MRQREHGSVLIEVLAGAAFLAFMLSIFAHSLKNMSELRKKLTGSRRLIEEAQEFQLLTPAAIEADAIEALASVLNRPLSCSRTVDSALAIVRCEGAAAGEAAVYHWRQN